jgi:hypothetical protein
MGAKILKSLLISTPKCTELNSESKAKLILVWVWVHTWDPDPIYTFLGGKVWSRLANNYKDLSFR